MGIRKSYIFQIVGAVFLSCLLTPVSFAGNLHSELSQQQNLQALVDEFVVNLQNDVRINHIFLASSSSEIHARLISILCDEQQFDCHPAQTSADTRDTTFPLSLTDINIVLQHLDQVASMHYLSDRMISQVAEKLTAGAGIHKVDVPLASL